jgi:hypothetical protein
LAEAKQLPDREQKAKALSGVGGALWWVDADESLVMLWESLSLARELGLKPLELGDTTGPGYNGWYYPPTSADEALGLVFLEAIGHSAPNADPFWAFARKLENADDREAVLEAAGKLLVKQKDLTRANGIATLLASPIRRTRLLIAITKAATESSLKN